MFIGYFIALFSLTLLVNWFMTEVDSFRCTYCGDAYIGLQDVTMQESGLHAVLMPAAHVRPVILNASVQAEKIDHSFSEKRDTPLGPYLYIGYFKKEATFFSSVFLPLIFILLDILTFALIALALTLVTQAVQRHVLRKREG